MQNSHIVAVWAVLAVVAGFSAPLARASRVSLLSEVEVRGNSIFLSDLMPPQVPQAIRDQAQRILIGTAPQPGSTRIFDGGRVAALMGPATGDRGFDVPLQIVVRRSGRKISREEVVAAIRAALRHSGLPDGGLQPDDLRVFPSVMVSSNDARLEVRRIDFDDTIHQAKFIMAEKGALPFLVTAQFRDDPAIQAATQETSPPIYAGRAAASSASDASVSQTPVALTATADSRMLRLVSGALVNATQVQGPTLVQAGKAATLFLNSGTMQMWLDVTALDRGSLHQTVRVRLPGTGKVLRAEVVGERRLEARF